MKTIFFAFLALASLSRAMPANLGLSFDKRTDTMPTLTLPYATYRAAEYNPNGDIYTFKNVRFGAPPVGDLRWTKPAPPATTPGIQDGSYGPICIQAPVDNVLPGMPDAALTPQSEDCLFLDVYVPAAAINHPSLKLPVISWFYGGGYAFGGKDFVGDLLPLYEGTGLIQESGGNVIFVASNYRVGAYGFLAGTTMENEGLPNAGLYDQRAALQWIQSYISLLGGDPTQVSAWGESAGAGSILHQLIAFGGTQDPLFSKAVLQSPAFPLLFDRRGSIEQTFQNFAALANCTGQGVACLRAASADTLREANTALNSQGPPGSFPVGPSPDGDLNRQLASLELAQGNFWPGITSLILSHVSDEAAIFVSPTIQTDAQFTAYLSQIYPPYASTAGVTDAIEARYPPVMNGTGGNYTTEFDRLKAYLGDSSFYCNIRYLSDAYAGKNYNLRYAVTPGLHASDIFPTFYNLNLDLDLINQTVSLPPGIGGFAQAYQSYLVSHARSGDPNTYKRTVGVPPAITWPKPNGEGEEIGGVLEAGDTGFRVVSDGQVRESVCGFWRGVAGSVTGLGGYAPPGSVIGDTVVPVTGDQSANYAS